MSKHRLIKVGGSLLGWPPCKVKLLEWLDGQTDARNIMIGGGGELADCVRKWDQLYQLGDVKSHRLALDCMSLTSKMLESWSERFAKTSNFGDLRESQEKYIIFDAASWVLRNSLLSESWDLTSDSIAASVASELSVDEFVLLKSCLPHESKGDFFDPLFREFVTTEVVRVVNLRSQEFEEILL